MLMVQSVMPRVAQSPRLLMTISIVGAHGPNPGRMQIIGSRAIHAALPSSDTQLAKPIQPSLADAPLKMVLPDP